MSVQSFLGSLALSFGLIIIMCGASVDHFSISSGEGEGRDIGSGVPAGYGEGQTLRRCVQQGWLLKRNENSLFTK